MESFVTFQALRVQEKKKTEIIQKQAKKYIWYPTASITEFSFYKQIGWFVLSPDSDMN